MKSKVCVSILIFIALLFLSQSANAEKIFLNPSNQTGNLVCGGGTEADYALLSANQASSKLQLLGHTVNVVQGFTGIPTQANTWGAQAFVSMHTNATLGGCSGTASGTETLYNKDSKPSDIVIASKIQPGLVNCLGLPDKKYHVWINPTTGLPDNLYVLSGLNMPGCLEEALFHDHPTDSAILRSSSGQEKIGGGVSNGVHTYFGGGEKSDLTIVEPVVVSPASVAPGGTIRVDWTEKNQGTAASTPAHNTKVFLSTSAYGTTYQIGYYGPMYTLGAGATQSYYANVVVPTSVPAGDYYVTVYIDCDSQVSEENENNNIGSSSPNRVAIIPLDTTPPTVTITSPTSSSTYSTSSSPLSIGGTASDNVGVTQVTWSNNRGGSGTCSGTTSWSASGITLYSGQDVITVTARDAANNTGTDTLTVTYTLPSNHDPQLSSGSVSPSSGNTSTTFAYTVNYYDQDGNSASTKYVYIDGSAYSMSLYSGSSANGTYRCQTTLSSGSHNYYFYFTDGNGGSARLPSSGTYSGPTVTSGGVVTMTVNPGTLDFGTVTVGQSYDKSVTIANVSSSTGTLIGNIGTVPVPFYLISDNSFSLAPGQSKSFTFRFSPTQSGTVSKSYSITHNASNQVNPLSLSIRGTGEGPILTISGYVTTSGGSGISGVAMNGLPNTPTTNSSGYYSDNTVSYSWSGTVIPTKSGYTFNPANRTYNNVTSNQSNQNYTGKTNNPPDKPTAISPYNTQANVPLELTLKSSSYSDQDGDAHKYSQFRVGRYDGVNMEVILYTGDYNKKPLNEFKLPWGLLKPDNTYYWKVRYSDGNLWSDWSEEAVFYTKTASNSEDTNNNGVPDDQEASDTDIDENGTNDNVQNNIIGLNNVVTHEDIGIKVSKGKIDAANSIDPDTLPDKPDDYSFPYGLFTACISGLDNGDTVLITYILPDAFLGSWYKYDEVNGWQNYDTHIHAYEGNKITIEVKDGGYGDCDGIENGVILDPGGPAKLVDDGDSGDSGGGGGGGGGGGCFIATACYGTPMAEEVKVLDRFRDECLLTNPVGTIFVNIYYKISPPIADFIREHPVLKNVVKEMLRPLIWISEKLID